MGQYLKESMVYLLSTILFLILYTFVSEKKRKKGEIYIPCSHYMGLWMLVLYLTLIFSSTVSPVYGFLREPYPVINLLPFKAWMKIGEEGLSSAERRSYLLDCAINVVMFVPLGFLLPFLWRRYKKALRVVLLGFYLAVMIELLQLFLARTTDIDDIINNTIGTSLGFVIFAIVARLSRRIGKQAMIKKGKNIRLPRFLRYEAELAILLTLSMTLVVGFSKCNRNMGYSQREKLQSFELIKTSHEQEDRFIGEDPLYTLENDDLWKENALQEDRDISTVELPISAQCAVLISANENTILYKKNSEEKIYPASTAKLVTALTVLEYCNINEVVEVGEEIHYVPMDASKAGLNEGQVLTIKMLLEGLLLPSGNDAAYVLASYTGKKLKGQEISTKEAISAFVTKMNETARYYGANHSYLLTPDGYDQEGQYTTAYDLGVIGKACLENSVIKNIVKCASISECFIDGTNITWNNSNELLDPQSDYYYPYAIGLKTGSTGGAGKCLISAATFRGETYISVVMNTTDEGRWEDSICLLDYGKEQSLD